ncbi:RabGAP/TBC, partial [Neocallimastix californiae]
IISMLYYWSPIFENIDYLPNMIFPFAKIYENDPFSCFEVLLTVLTNYCQKWWEFYPNPPVNCLNIIESLLYFHDKDLYDHFVKYNITSQFYGWELISNLFSDILSKDEWLCLWDNILTRRDTSYLYYFSIAYLKYFKQSILRITDIDEFMYFLHKENPCQISKLIKLTYIIKKYTPEELKFKNILKPYYSLDSHSNYPIFNEYPKYIMNSSNLKEKIRTEDEEDIKKIIISEELRRISEELKKDYRQMKLNKWKMNNIVSKWWESMIENEDQYLSLKQRSNYFESNAQTQEQYANLISKIITNNQAKIYENIKIENINNIKYDNNTTYKEWESSMNDLNQMKTGDQEMNTKQIEKTLNNGGLNN